MNKQATTIGREEMILRVWPIFKILNLTNLEYVKIGWHLGGLTC